MNVAEMTRVSAILSPAGGRWAGTGQRVLLLDTSHETTYERVHAHMHASPELFGLKGQIEIAQYTLFRLYRQHLLLQAAELVAR
eukprot:scaffold1563_cov44-Cyclotella_meneghiniana.AAC.2